VVVICSRLSLVTAAGNVGHAIELVDDVRERRLGIDPGQIDVDRAGLRNAVECIDDLDLEAAVLGGEGKARRVERGVGVADLVRAGQRSVAVFSLAGSVDQIDLINDR